MPPSKKRPTFTGKNTPGRRMVRGYQNVLRKKKGKK